MPSVILLTYFELHSDIARFYISVKKQKSKMKCKSLQFCIHKRKCLKAEELRSHLPPAGHGYTDGQSDEQRPEEREVIAGITFIEIFIYIVPTSIID